MSLASYLARFRNATGEFFTAILAWPAPPGPLLPSSWWRNLRSQTKVDLALRLTGGDKPSVLLLLTADRGQPLEELLATLRGVDKPVGLREPNDSTGFDELAGARLTDKHLRVHHGDYHWENNPLACDFRFYHTWSGQGLPEAVSYQTAMRFQRPDAEQERRVRKYLAWLELEEPFTPSVRALQHLLAGRLLSAGWLTDEYLLSLIPRFGSNGRTVSKRIFVRQPAASVFANLPSRPVIFRIGWRPAVIPPAMVEFPRHCRFKQRAPSRRKKLVGSSPNVLGRARSLCRAPGLISSLVTLPRTSDTPRACASTLKMLVGVAGSLRAIST